MRFSALTTIFASSAVLAATIPGTAPAAHELEARQRDDGPCNTPGTYRCWIDFDSFDIIQVCAANGQWATSAKCGLAHGCCSESTDGNRAWCRC
ncbi:hypothetical protein GGTG_04410 [Gaeumannomyces tritici R3-111a-1]|uniref:Invertebrate defensins family profile domain-containing protein n=1 Tax=Gaeumannomyces tritici (strain R3-111a-1) TaxID=644352 RepID=J3NT12_GAET3|nr:hypothetical protein GGTG_04410 [Gaeumannomyces tritici R3-111a-1]EJT79325.1 hypothetical protein GGTG_04410 [Gaeumannomyces tritici R3-111a-1]